MMEVGATQKGLAKVISVSSPLQLKQADENPNLRWHKALDATARAWEGPFKKEAERLFNEESDGLLAILRKEGKAAKMGLAFQLFLLAAVDFLTASTGEWRKGFYPLFDALLTAQGENIAARFGISFDLESPEVKSFLEGYTMRFSERMFAVDEKAINSLVQIAQGEGWSVPQLRDAIADEWGGFAEKRAEMIARTETIRSSNAGAKEAMREAGFKQIKWLTHIDDRTCDWCIDMDGKTIDIEDNFFDQGEQYTVTGKDGKEHSIVLDYDDVGYLPLHTDCRCTVVTVRED
jgi:SPP1 gp7 family putative phage head morphogenesis protein